MKTGKKFLLGTLLVAGAAAAVYVSYRCFKKEIKKIEEAEKEDQEEFERLGLNPEKVQEELIPGVDDNNLVKTLYLGVNGNPKFDIDILQGALDCETPIYITQSEYKGKNSLDIYFEIPRIKQTDKNSPKLRDYIDAFKNLANNIGEKFKYIVNPHMKLCGFVCLEGTSESGEREQILLPIPQEAYSVFATEKNDGIVEFVNKTHSGTPEEKEVIKSKLESTLTYEGHQLSNFKYVESFLMWKMSYRISGTINDREDKSNYWDFGINLPMGLDIISYIVDNLTVQKLDRNTNTLIGEKKYYQNIFFCAPKEDGTWDMLSYYDTDKENHVCIEPIFFETD